MTWLELKENQNGIHLLRLTASKAQTAVCSLIQNAFRWRVVKNLRKPIRRFVFFKQWR